MIADLRADVRELRSEMTQFRSEMIRRFEHVDNRFNWVIGLQFAVLLAAVSAALAAYLR